MIAKETFCKILNTLEKYRKDAEDLTDNLAKVFCEKKGNQMLSDHQELQTSLYDMFADDNIIDDITSALEIEMKDCDNQWINYYVYDLDWGKENKNDHMKVWDNNNNEIPLTCAEELYDLLCKNLQTPEEEEDDNEILEEVENTQPCDEDCSTCCCEDSNAKILNIENARVEDKDSSLKDKNLKKDVTIEDLSNAINKLTERYNDLFKDIFTSFESTKMNVDTPKTGQDN